MRFRWDTGEVTPTFVPEGPIDYIGRIKWTEEEGGKDYLSCTRKEVFSTIQWYVCLGHSNGLFQLDLAQHYKSIIYPDIVAIQYSDASGSELRARLEERIKNRIRASHSQFKHRETLICRHGSALSKFGRTQYKKEINLAAFYGFLSNNRKEGLRFCLEGIGLDPISLQLWYLLLAGSLIGRNAIVFGYYVRNLLGIRI